jgi:hypothetical protein
MLRGTKTAMIPPCRVTAATLPPRSSGGDGPCRSDDMSSDGDCSVFVEDGGGSGSGASTKSGDLLGLEVRKVDGLLRPLSLSCVVANTISAGYIVLPYGEWK